MAGQQSRQIQQMKAFILQEANEKSNEINIKVGAGRRPRSSAGVPVDALIAIDCPPLRSRPCSPTLLTPPH